MLESQLLRSDLVLIAGTFASGGFDMVQEVLAELGEMRFRAGDHAPRPARRASAGWAATTCRSSASPASRWPRWSSFEVFVRPAIRLMLGKRQLFRRTVQAIAGQPLISPLGYRQYLHGTVMRHPDGGYVVEPVGDGTEALLARMARANCLIVDRRGRHRGGRRRPGHRDAAAARRLSLDRDRPVLHPGWPARLAWGPVELHPLRRGDAAEWSRLRLANEDVADARGSPPRAVPWR